MSDANRLPPVVERFIAAMNSFDDAGLMATLSDDAFVNDVQREFWGKADIAAFARRELTGPKVTMAVKSARTHYGMLALDAEIDGEFDKANLPSPLILTFYFLIEAELIVSLFIMRNPPTPKP